MCGCRSLHWFRAPNCRLPQPKSSLYVYTNVCIFARALLCLWKLCRFHCVHYFSMVANNSIRNSSAGNKFTNLKSLRYAESMLAQNREVGRGTTGWNKDFARQNPFLSSYSLDSHTTAAHKRIYAPDIHLYRSFNRIQNITLGVSATLLLFTPFATMWIDANQWILATHAKY